MKKNRGLVIASAVALLITSQSFAATETSAPAKSVKCFGVNSCRGKGQCSEKGSNACAGQNACQGKGWLYSQAADQCQARGGRIVK